MEEYIETNRKRWDELADIHINSDFYNVKEFKSGKNTIGNIELDEVGDVKSKKMLHLQCHFGLDTLSWARLGAFTTGVDFSDRAIYHAKNLSKEVGINSNFIQSDLYDLREKPIEPNSFDIVFTSHGTIYWLPDLKEWANIISHFLKQGGIFYIMDSHPTGHIFDDEHESALKVRYPYFHNVEPLMFDEEGSYADPSIKLENKREYGWQHSISDTINSLIEAGLSIEFVHEFPFLSWKMLPFMVKRDGWWHLPDSYQKLPLMFSLKAKKE